MYDVVVIGGGPGGYAAAIRLSKLGKKVALIEKNELGGTCTNVGCIPTKALLSASHLYSEINDKAKRFGITVEEFSYDVGKIMKHSKKATTLSRKGLEHLLNKNNVEIIKGTAEIIDKGKIRIKESGSFIEGENLILAQGSDPANFPPFEDVEGIMTSDDVFNMKKFPESILIIGGGYIGVEFATFFSSFGVKVHLVEILDQILSTEDEDVAEDIKKALKRKSVKVLE
ncbi:MAG: FAD-dependent oxidoreductase, partial [Kosmotogaceae bacterium]